jgi:hypothetical protein
MRTAIVCGLLLVLLPACGDDAAKRRESYLAGFLFERIAPPILAEEEVVGNSQAGRDAAGLYVRYERESELRKTEAKPDDLAGAVADAAKKDLESRGFRATIVNNERAIYFVEYENETWSGTVFVHAKKEPDGVVRLVFRINEAEKGE